MTTYQQTFDAADVTYTIECMPEEEGPEGFFASGDDEQDAEDCRRIRADLQWNEWAWFCARVTASWGGFEGDDYLGGCSYRDEADFRACTFEDMQELALDDLKAELERNGWTITE